MSNKNRNKTVKDRDNMLRPRRREILRLGCTPTRVVFLKVKPDFQGWGQGLVQFTIQSSNTVPPAKSPMQRESRWIGMPNLSAKLMQSKHDGGHTQSFYSNVSAVLLPRLKKGLDSISSWPSLKCHIKQDGSKGWCQICVYYRKTLQSDLCVIESLKLRKD